MNELEKELLLSFKNFVTQYEQDLKQQSELISNLMRQIQSLNSAINVLTNKVEQLEKAYQDILNVLEE